MVKTMTTPKVPMGRRKRIRISVADWSWVRSGSMTRTGWTCAGACWVLGVAGPALLARSPLMSSMALTAPSKDCPAEEWTEEIFFWMLSRYSGRLRATLRSWRVTTYPTEQMMVEARNAPGFETADGGRQEKRECQGEGEGDEKLAGKVQDQDGDREHEEGSNPGELGASSVRHTTSRSLMDGVACPGKNTSRQRRLNAPGVGRRQR